MDARQLHSTTAGGAVGGSFWGLLFGILFFVPLLVMAVGAAMGALSGSLNDVGIDDDQESLRAARTELSPATRQDVVTAVTTLGTELRSLQQAVADTC